MSYTFSGVFADGDQNVLEDLQRQRPGRARVITSPFSGFGVAFASDHDWSEEETPQTLGVVSWSRQHPKVTFVYLYAECFGGDCGYAGLVVRDGLVLLEESGGDYPTNRCAAC